MNSGIRPVEISSRLPDQTAIASALVESRKPRATRRDALECRRVILSDYSHVIFDLDGVLLDTEKLYTEATQQVVGQYGKTFEWSLKSLMMGRHELEAAELLVQTLGIPITAHEYLRRQL